MPDLVKYVGWAVTAAAAAVYLAMVVITLPHLAAMAGNAPVFDLRPLGYDFATAQDILRQLGADGAAYYQNVQQKLDAAFPVLLCLTLVFWLIAAARRWQGQGLPLSSAALGVLLAVAVIANAADLGEHAAVSTMLQVGARGLTPAMVENASRFTLAKTFFSVLAFSSLIVLALGPLLRSVAGRPKP